MRSLTGTGDCNDAHYPRPDRRRNPGGDQPQARGEARQRAAGPEESSGAQAAGGDGRGTADQGADGMAVERDALSDLLMRWAMYVCAGNRAGLGYAQSGYT